ncbi:MAG: molybdopterin-binding protein [Betaproteobacteria bacterium]|nr:molybdopterin-binding protein [Betaproteobacteria bacterium]
MAIGALIIGDEILVGKRQDRHFAFLIGALAGRGLRLAWCEYLGDDPPRITAALARSFASGDIVFSFGGIGATPDDHTRGCAAAALGVPLALHPEARAEILGRFGGEATPQRLKMGELPQGCEIIPNPVNRIPGFTVREHYFVPGFPQMAWPMVESVLDTKYRHLFGRDRWAEASIFVVDAGESQLVPVMEAVEARYRKLKVFSLPSMGPDGARLHVELGVRGDPEEVSAAIDAVRAGVRQAGFRFTESER